MPFKSLFSFKTTSLKHSPLYSNSTDTKTKTSLVVWIHTVEHPLRYLEFSLNSAVQDAHSEQILNKAGRTMEGPENIIRESWPHLQFLFITASLLPSIKKQSIVRCSSATPFQRSYQRATQMYKYISAALPQQMFPLLFLSSPEMKMHARHLSSHGRSELVSAPLGPAGIFGIILSLD